VSAEEANPSLQRTTELQSKLYQAARSDVRRRFHSLYDKLYVPYVLRSAWLLVRRNGGSGGIDGRTIEEIEEEGVEAFLSEVAQSLREKSYRPTPVRRVHIPKGDGRVRPLGIPTIRDRVVQAAAKLVLEPIFEADFGDVSYGFRPGIGQQEALAAVEEQSRKGFRWVVDADIERFFDTLDHQKLMEALRRRISDGAMLRLIYRWLKAGFLLEGVVYETEEGSPQGGVLSPLLANVYLHTFDVAFRKQKTFIGHLTRYADDFVIQCGTQEQAERALAWAKGQLEGLGLRLHVGKTRIVNDREVGFDFLGFHHRRVVQSHGKSCGRESMGVLRWPRGKACARLRVRVRQVLRSPWWVRHQWHEITSDLRRYLRGWCQYFRHGASARVFRKLDEWIRVRVCRDLARAQPTGKKRRPRPWTWYVRHRSVERDLPRLMQLRTLSPASRSGRANARWRAV
jgi:RNA-directed DNA polymerase